MTSPDPRPRVPAGTRARTAHLAGPWGRTAARMVLGAVLLTAGLSKVGDPLAMVNSVRNYQLLPDPAAQAVGYTLPGVEIVLGLLLVLGVAVRLASAAT